MGLPQRAGNRWRGKNAVELLNDFDFLLQALFAEQSNTALETHNKARAGDHSAPIFTRFEKLRAIWERLLPRRSLLVSGDSVKVTTPEGGSYPASEMSDGERAVFYILGQALVAAVDSALIVDEPELHLHPSIMAALWDEIEAARTDCAFVFITHDLAFAATRVAKKFVVREYKAGPMWTIEAVPAETGFKEELATLILGSRKPVLFVEGTSSSVDQALCRACYPGWTVIPRGSCDEVIHSVVTMRRNASLTRVECCGLVDADDRDAQDVERLRELGIGVLPVSELENLMLLPQVAEQIAAAEGFAGEERLAKLEALKGAIFGAVSDDKAIEKVVARHCRRKIDRLLKAFDLGDAESVGDLTEEFTKRARALDVSAIANAARERIDAAIAAKDLAQLLTRYDNKGLLALAAQHLRSNRRDAFEEWLVRVLNGDSQPALIAALRSALPVLSPR